MKCLTIEEIYKYIENELTGLKRQKVEKHLSTCPRCPSEVEERKLIIQAAESLPDIKLPHDFSQVILNRIFPPKISVRGWLAAFAGGISAAAIAFVSFFIMSGYNSTHTLINIYRALIDTFRNISILAAKFIKTTTLIIKVMAKIAGYGIKGIVGAANLLSIETQLVLIFLTIVLSVLLLIKVRRLMSNGETA